jgi:hypothetical protein
MATEMDNVVKVSNLAFRKSNNHTRAATERRLRDVVPIYFRCERISQQRVEQYEARSGDLYPRCSPLRISVRHQTIVFVAQIVQANRSE